MIISFFFKHLLILRWEKWLQYVRWHVAASTHFLSDRRFYVKWQHHRQRPASATWQPRPEAVRGVRRSHLGPVHPTSCPKLGVARCLPQMLPMQQSARRKPHLLCKRRGHFLQARLPRVSSLIWTNMLTTSIGETVHEQWQLLVVPFWEVWIMFLWLSYVLS